MAVSTAQPYVAPTPPVTPRKSKLPLMIGSLVLVAIVGIGTLAALFLLNQPQDIRQQASGNNCCFDSSWPGGPCNVQYDWDNGYNACTRGECNLCKKAATCGNSQCEPGEDHNNCSQDCTITGGNNTGTPPATDNSTTCYPGSPTAPACQNQPVGSACVGFPGTCVNNATSLKEGYAVCGCSRLTKVVKGDCYINFDCVSNVCIKPSGSTKGTCQEGPAPSPTPTTNSCKLCNCLAGDVCIPMKNGIKVTKSLDEITNETTDGTVCYKPTEVDSFTCQARDTTQGVTIQDGQEGQGCGAFDRSACGTGGCQPGWQRTCQSGSLGACVVTDACAYQNAQAGQVAPNNSCQGLKRLSSGEKSRGNFVGCYQGQNCFCGGTMVAVGQTVDGTGTVSCYGDLQNDSCAAPGFHTTTTPPASNPPSTNPPPSTPPGTNPPTPTPPASIPPSDTSFVCSALTASKPTPKIGDSISFTCAASGAGASLVDNYQFRYRVDNGQFTTIAASSSQATLSVPIVITSKGSYFVECRACQGTNCTNWSNL